MKTVDADDYLELATPGDPRVAPDGERVAFVRKRPRTDDGEHEDGDDVDGERDDDEGEVTDAEDAADGDDAGGSESEAPDATDCEKVEATVYVARLGGDEVRRFTAERGVDAEPRWSPSGDRLAFTSDRDDAPGSQLWVLPADGGEARRVTCVAGGASSLAWGPDGDRIAFLQPVTAADREAGRDRDVDEEYERDEPDPRVIDRTVYRTAERYSDGRRAHVYVADLDTETGGDGDDEVYRVTDGDIDHTAPAWGDDGALYFGARDPEDPEVDPDDTVEFALRRREPVDGEGETDEAEGVDTAGAAVETLVYDDSWAPRLDVAADGRVAYASSPDERGTLQQTDVHVYDPETESVRNPTAELDRTLSAESPLQFAPDDDAVYVQTPETGSLVVRRVPVAAAGTDDAPDGTAGTADAPDGTADDPGDAGRRSTAVETAIVAGEGMHCDGFHVAADVLAFAASEWDHPGDVFAATPRGAEETRLTSLNRDYLADRAIVQPEELAFDAGDPADFDGGARERDVDAGGGDAGSVDTGAGEEDGLGAVDGLGPVDGEIQGWLFTPPELGPTESAPLVVEVHGGPHVTWTPSGTMWHEFQALAAAGFAVFACNPRGSTGYGEAFQAAIERDWGAVTGADVLAGVDAVEAREAVDESETFVAGGSFGGYMTAWLLAHTDAFDAGVPQRGVYDLVSFYGSTDGAYKLVEWDWGATPWDDPELLYEHSPAMHADEITAPTLVMHAENDYRVPVGAAELLYRGLRKHGTPTRLVRYPREGHELSRSGEPGHVVDRIRRIRDWFRGYSEAFEDDQPI